MKENRNKTAYYQGKTEVLNEKGTGGTVLTQ